MHLRRRCRKNSKGLARAKKIGSMDLGLNLVFLIFIIRIHNYCQRMNLLTNSELIKARAGFFFLLLSAFSSITIVLSLLK